MSKKYILLLVFMLTILALTGCSKAMSVSTLNNYFKTEKASGDKNISITLEDNIKESRETLEKVRSTLRDLDLLKFETASNQAWTIDELVTDLQQWQTDAINIPLRTAEGNNTDYGTALWKAVTLESYSQTKMLSRVTNAIILDILYAVNSSSDSITNNWRGNLMFGDSTSGTVNPQPITYSDVDVALTLYGYEVVDLDLEVYDGTELKNWWNLGIKTEAKADVGLYKFYWDPDKLNDDLSVSFTGFSKKENKNTDNTVHIQFVNDSGDSDYGKAIEKYNDYQAKKSTDYKDYNDWDFFETLTKYKRGVMIDSGYLGYSINYKNYSDFKSDTTLNFSNSSEANCIYYRTQIGTVQAGSSIYSIEVYIKLKNVYGGESDEYHMDIQQIVKKAHESSSTVPFDLLPNAEWKTQHTGYGTSIDITASSIYDHLKQYKDFVPISINGKKYADLTTSLAALKNYQPLDKQLVYLGAGQDGLDQDDQDQDPKDARVVDLFANLKKENITKVKTVNLYIGCQKLGTLKLNVLNEEIALIGSADVSGLNGTNSTQAYQTCKVYCTDLNNGLGQKLYVLFGLYDVAVVNGFHALQDGGTDYWYYPEYTNGGFLYNIFDENIYAVNAEGLNTKYGHYDSSGGVTLYSGKDVVIYKDCIDNINKVKNKNAAELVASLGTLYEPISKSLAKTRTMFALRSYEEGLFLPNVYKKDLFVCLGRKVVFSEKLFNGDWLHTFTFSSNVRHSAVGQQTPLYTVRTSTEANEYYEGSAHPVSWLVSSKTYTKSKTLLDPAVAAVLTSNPKGLRRLVGVGIDDKILTSGQNNTVRDTNVLTADTIYAGKLKTYNGEKTGSQSQLFAADEVGVGQNYPPIWVWCTLHDVTVEIADYFKTVDFQSWVLWLNNNGYRTYLANFSMDDLQTLLIERISTTYDIAFSETEEEDTIIFDTAALEKTENWLNENNEKRTNAVIDTILRIIGIILIGYAILLFVCAIIDTVAIGEGDGLLKKVSFNRMKTVTGMTRAQRKDLSERSEKGTYTTRAVNIMGVFPTALILLTVAALLLIGSSYSLIDMLMDIADGITNIFRGGIGKVD